MTAGLGSAWEAGARFARQRPAVASLCIFCGIVALRTVDTFVIRSDRWFGEQFVTKLAGIALLAFYLAWADIRWSALGFHARSWGSAAAVGASVMGMGLACGYVAEWSILGFQGLHPTLVFRPDDSGAATLAGNIVNATMEEGLFRGLLLSQLALAMSVRKANFVQAVLFGLWHLVWPVREYLNGAMAAQEAIIFGLGYVAVSGLIGFAWGAMAIWTGSIWAGWAAHLLNNLAYSSVIFTIGQGGMPDTSGIRVLIAVLVVTLFLPLVRRMWRGDQ